MPFTFDPFGPMHVPDKSGGIFRIESRAQTEREPTTFFEWHQQSKKVYVIREVDGRVTRDGKLLGTAETSDVAKALVTAYVVGFGHGTEFKPE